MPFINKHDLRILRADSDQLMHLQVPFLPGAQVVIAEKYPLDPDYLYIVGEDGVIDHFHSDADVKRLITQRVMDLLNGPNAELLDRVHQLIVDNGGEVPPIPVPEPNYAPPVGYEPFSVGEARAAQSGTTSILSSREEGEAL